MTAATDPCCQEIIVCEFLPLAVYREIAAHLQLVPQLEVMLLPAQPDRFVYRGGPVGGMRLVYPLQWETMARQQMEAILQYYSDRHGPWQRQHPATMT